MHSLLWPEGPPTGPVPVVVPPQALVDLELAQVAEWLCAARAERRAFALDLLSRLPLDARVSRHRGAVVAELVAHPRLCDRLGEVRRALRLLAAHRPEAFPREAPRASRIGARVVELQAYVEVVRLLQEALAAEDVCSDGLLALRADAAALAADESYAALTSELPHWRRALDEVRTVTVAVEVSPALEPEGAALIDFSREAAAPRTFALSRLLGEETGRRGRVRLFRRHPVDWQGGEKMVGDVRALLEAVAAPVERALHGYRLVNAQAVAPLEDELLVLLGAAALARRWSSAGLPVCLPEVLTPPTGEAAPTGGDREWFAEEAYHPVLALQLPQPGTVVRNRLSFGADGAVWVLTGPNRGGKTTYLRAAGVIQVLAQAGLPVPAARARVQTVDRVATHFPLPEAGKPGMGRLDEEAGRVAEVFATCTGRSLVLLNEVLAGTSAPEALALAVDVLRGFRALGLRCVYATHLHELAARCEEINASIAGPGLVASLTVEAVPDEAGPGGRLTRRPTYRVVPGQPAGASYFASRIARQHGISLPQILAGLRARGVLPPGVDGPGAVGAGDPG